MSDDGKVTGTPTQAMETVPWVWVHDRLPSQGGYEWCIGDNHSERQFVFRVSAGSVTNLNPVKGAPTTGASWSIASGSLPPGVNFSSDGVLSGTPTAEGSYTFVVRAANGSGTVTDTETETLTVRQPITLTSRLNAASKAEVGVPFTAVQSAAGGTGTFVWSFSRGVLPAGLTLDASGAIIGTPAVAGRFQFTVTATDTDARSESVEGTLVIAKRLAFGRSKLNNARARAAYRARLSFVGGVAPLTWQLRGKPPKGLRLSKTGLLLGKPKAAGTYRFTVTVRDALGASAKRTVRLIVKQRGRTRSR